MRKVRLYTAYFTGKSTLKKSAVDGYLDDNCEIAYYRMKGSSYWRAILLSCDMGICVEKKRYECVEVAHLELKAAKITANIYDYKGLLKNSEMANEDERIHNHWTEANNFLDLTTKEGLKILQSIKSIKCKNKPL